MPKISNYTQVTASKLADKLVCDQEDSGVTSTKSVSIEQIGNAVNALQVRSDLDTQAQTIVSAINEIASYTPVYGNTASGAIATFDTSLALPLQDLQIAINAVQEEGTPTPSSPKLISGFTGANIKVNGLNLFGGTYDGTKFPLHIKSGTQLTASIKNVGSDARITYYREDNTQIDYWGISSSTAYKRTFTLSEDAYYFAFTKTSGTNPLEECQLELGDTVHAFEPYTANVTVIDWQTEAGTVSEGTLDVTTGVLTVTWGSVDMGSLTWTYDSTYHRMKSNSIADMKKVNTARTLVFLCPIYQVISDGRSIANVPNDSIYASFDSDQKTAVWVHDSDYSDANVFKTAMSGIYIVYPLETPVTYQLTPTQISAIVGTNNVFTDTNGNTSVVYACSLKDYIDSQ